MEKTLRALHVEDSERDAALLTRHLSQAGYELICERVDKPETMRAAFTGREWDIVFCDYSMPQFNALAALDVLKETGLDIPFIIISGTVGEDVAVQAMRAGAHDYLMKDNLARLVPTIEREIHEAENRRARRQAEDQLRINSAALQAAANSILITDRAGTIIWVNPALTQTTGYSPEDVLGKNPRLFKSGKQDPAFYKDMWKTILSGKVWRNTIINRCKDGTLNHEDLTITPVCNSAGKITHFVGIKQDITEKTRTEEALYASELRYRRLFESAKDGILILDGDTGQIVDANPYLLELLGLSNAQIEGKELWEIGPFKDIVASKLAFAELQQNGYIRYENLPLQSQEGLARQVEVVSNSYLAGESRVIQCNIRDITERKHAEEALRESEARYHTLFEYAPDGILIADTESYYLDANATMCRMLGYSRDELIGLHASQIVTPSEIPHIDSALDVIKGNSDHHREWQFRRKEGSVFAAEVIATMMPDGNLMGMVRDITERKRAEEELLRTNQSLESALAELRTKTQELSSMTQQLWQASKLATMGELAASVAHELNNPLATISLHLEILVGQLADADPNRRSLLVVEQEVQRMATLVSNLLIFSRRSHQQISTIDMAEELENSLEFIHYHLRSRKIVIVKEFANALPSVQADRQQLRQVFLNLLTNASDAMPQGGTLTVRARQTDDGQDHKIAIEFSDTGVGIEPEDLAKLWEPFFTTKPEGKGTGLGLPICRRAVEEHRGTIDIKSLPGKGTTARIILPTIEGSN